MTLRRHCVTLLLTVLTGTAVPAPPGIVPSTSAVPGPEPLAAQELYYPGAHPAWERRDPADLGFDPGLLREAVRYAQEAETENPRDLELNHYLSWGREPMDAPVGPFKVRGDPTGLIVKDGYIVAEWGDPGRVDMTYSVTKSFLSTTVGLAWSRGLIRDVHDPVGPYMAPMDLPGRDGEPGLRESFGEEDPVTLFESEHNRTITWNHLLRQTSDWEGTLWGKPDWADRPRGDLSEWLERERDEPGSAYKYNDVRVNLLALAAMNVWRRPLPEVLREHVMDPIGASRTWRWHGYDNSWVEIDGTRMQSVSGGGHWGGGMWINAYDQARFGLFTLRRGRWNGDEVLPDAWFDMATTPTPAEPGYGFMNYFLNTGRERYPAAPESVYAHLGAGSNVVYVDPENELVVVARWIRGDARAGLVERVLRALGASVTDDGGAGSG